MEENLKESEKNKLNKEILTNRKLELKEQFLKEEISAEQYGKLKQDIENELEQLEKKHDGQELDLQKEEVVRSEKNGGVQKKEEKTHKLIKKSSGRKGWKLASIMLFAIFLLSLFTGGFKDFLGAGNVQDIGAQNAADQAVEYVNTNLLQGATTADLEGVSESGDLYKIDLDIGGRKFESYMTKDGKYLFPQGIDLEEEPQAPAPSSQPSVPSTGGRLDVSVDDDPSIGPEDAPVTIVEFSDYQCPFCARAEPTIEQVLKEYEGKVRLVYRDFPLSFHQNAQKAAEATECADEQGKFWEYHDKLFENQDALDVNNLKQYAKDLGLDSSKFDNCLDSGKYTEEVQKDLADGQSLGVSGTPAFFINGRLVSGAQPFSAFKQVIDGELAK